ncbi:MAG: hypothetical protein IT444_09860 [Phycisphaeraceae bacterium]|nr:hypothetical protein [Phycisphaeraceae bacterium]
MRTILATLVVFCFALTVSAEPVKPPSQLTTERLVTQMHALIEQRQIKPRFDRLVAFIGERFDASAGLKTFSDKTGNCRLAWVDHLLRHPLEAVAESEVFTRLLHDAAKGSTDSHQANGDLDRIITIVAAKLDASEPEPVRQWSKDVTPMDELANALKQIRAATDAARKGISASEWAELRANLYAQSTGDAGLGHRFADVTKGRQVCDLLEKLDRRAWIRAAYAVVPLVDTAFLTRLTDFKTDHNQPATPGATGPIVQIINTAEGKIVVGGREANQYNLDEMKDVAAVVDLGGDDTYLEGTTSDERPVLIVIDLAGDDTYRGEKSGIQGSPILGVSILIDAAGNDSYTARDIAQGSALSGVGMLIDLRGDDKYVGDRRVQGSAIGGIGILLDRAGDDDFRAALLSQGVGGPLGFGLLDDLAGKDHYYAGGKYPGGYDDTPGFGGWSQGVGVGPRGVANGGIGVFLDGGGDDVYEADYFSQGGAYWFAAGFARDFGGNDQRVGATRTNFDSTPRTVQRFVRWGTGYGCHYAAGFLIDDAGDDTYGGNHACVGFTWDIAVGVILDFAGNDQYAGEGNGGAGSSNNAGISVVYDASGDDVYAGPSPGTANPAVDYHEDAGGNFSFLIDEGGKDQYGSEMIENRELERGWKGGFLIDRQGPTP